MALELPFDMKNGVIANYWKVVGVSFEIPRNMVTLTVGLYYDAEARLGNKEPIDVKTFSAVATIQDIGDLLRATKNDLTAAVYFLLKRLPEFQGATDI